MEPLVRWLLGGFVVSLLFIVVARWFWKRYDRPSEAALEWQREQEEKRKERKVWESVEMQMRREAEEAERKAAFQIKREMDNVDQIETNQCCKETDVSFCQSTLAFSNKPISSFKMSLQLIETFKQGCNGFIVRFLGTSKSRFVDTIVDRFVICVNHVVDFLHQFWWAESRSITESFL